MPIDRENGDSGTSIFDPVMAQLAYQWFCPKGGKVFDPFAGGSVRGIVASWLGFYYTGIDLSAHQIEANRIQAKEILKESNPHPIWHIGDSAVCSEFLKGEQFDLIFSCPPYGDLEVYSDDPKDLSRMSHDDMIKSYRKIIIESVKMLKPDRFACFVVGDYRDKKGFYRNFVSQTIDAFQAAGMLLYNEAILITAIGSLPIRVGRMFTISRKLGKTHQNVLVFFKGNIESVRDWPLPEFGNIEQEQ